MLAALVLLIIWPFAGQAAPIAALTYNVWEMEMPEPIHTLIADQMSKDIPERMGKICQAFQQGASERRWDLIFLQEVWNIEYQEFFKKCGFIYHVTLDQPRSLLLTAPVFFIARIPVMESGLMILSRHPIDSPTELDRLKYQKNGEFCDFAKDGEACAAKSGIFGVMVHPEFGRISMANTHLVSAYPHNSYKAQRRDQLEAYVAWARVKSQGRPLIIGGDLNGDINGKLGYDLEFAAVVDQQFKDFEKMPQTIACTSCPDNGWFPPQEAAGWVDVIYGSKNHFKSVSGGLVFHDQTYISPVYGKPRFMSDHYALETRFETRN